jgi:hypothetical protein
MIALGISSYPGHCGGELEGEYSGARMETGWSSLKDLPNCLKPY